MNAYQLPFNGATSTPPFNYFSPNTSSPYSISSSYQNSRSATINPAQKNMTSQSSLLSYNQFSHQSHLQPFGTPIQSASGANHYSQNQYNAYTGTSSPSLASGSAANNFDYSHNYHNSNSHLPSSSSYSQYISNCSATGYPSYPQVPTTAHVQGPSSSIPSANSNYQSLNTESYLNLSAPIKAEPGEAADSYTLSLHKDDLALQPVTKKAKKTGSRGRAKRNLNPSPSPDTVINRIFVWCIDETVFVNMTENNRYGSFNEHIVHLQALYNEFEMFIIKFGEKYLFLDDLSNIDQSFVEESAADDNGQDISNYDFSNDGFKSTVTTQMGGSSTRSSSVDLRQKMALRFRKIAEVYNTYADKLHELLDKPELEQLDSLMRRYESITNNWISSAIKALHCIKSRPNCLNILISSSPLIKTLSKVMLFKLSPYFAVNNIYSYTKSTKEHILNRVVNRYGTACPYIIIGKSDDQNISQKAGLCAFISGLDTVKVIDALYLVISSKSRSYT
ncbi:haloacid dehalogenase-like hydrolase [Tyrophagus putrescentiae]|nr:haloacid dehalogenase-like hydrolase [Tyrophagus putrescentiae]